jgi:hypothetical protein
MLHSWPLDDDQGHGNAWQLAYEMELSHFVGNRHRNSATAQMGYEF